MRCQEWGVLPESGGWYDQSHEITEAFGIISDEISKEEMKKQKLEEMKARRR